MRKVTLPRLTEKAQKVFNAYIRQRDSKDGYFTCISCFKTLPIAQINAGHYVPVSKSSFLRFHPDNCHAECISDNGFNGFHLVGYRKNLIMKIGQKKVQWLEDNQNTVHKWTRSELEEIIEHYSKLLKTEPHGIDNNLPF
jgi:hypothetical protein